MDKILERINKEDDIPKMEKYEAPLKLLCLILVIVVIFVAVDLIGDYTRANYMDTVYLNDGSSYSSNVHDIIINDGYSVIIDDREYSWDWVDHIQLHQKKGEE